MMLLTLLACQKEEFNAVDDEAPPPNSAASNTPLVTRSVEDSIPTILGGVRVNPFKVSTMTQAWNALYGEHQHYNQLPVTHRYIKLEPQDTAEFKSLVASGIPFLDFPLDREVIQMGDHYPKAAPAEGGFPDFYTVLADEATVPITHYTVLEELVIPPMDAPLTATAFFIAGDTATYLQELLGPDYNPEDPEPTGNCPETCPNYPNCELFPESFGCSGPPVWNDECTPDSPDWPDCLVHYDDGEDETNACDCPIPNNKRKPAGCIQVEDVQMNNIMLGVEDVEVKWWDGWFTFKTTSTDGAGCWSIDRHRERGKAYMWVTFRNSRATLRGFVGNTAKLWRLLLPVTDYRGQLGGGSYHNIQIDYNMWNNQGGSDHRTWSASTVMNGIHHFHREAQNDGINTPPSGLDVYLTANRTDGIALMTSQLPQQTVNDLVGQGLFSSSLLPYIISNNSILAAVPDVAIGCNFRESDEQWSIVQHELAHTSHFTNAGAIFWGRLGLATLNAEIATGDPWGDEDVFDAGILAICESWAEHLEHVYTDRAYGGNTSLFPAGRTWERELELTRNDSPNHVPIGLHFDLFDNMLDANNACDRQGGCGPIIDNVAGFTNGQLFSLLDANTDDPDIYRVRILNELLPGSGNMAADIDALFNSY